MFSDFKTGKGTWEFRIDLFQFNSFQSLIELLDANNFCMHVYTQKENHMEVKTIFL